MDANSCAGHRTQDAAAEDPLTALCECKQPDYELYWKKKLLLPLKEIFSTCLDKKSLNVRVVQPKMTTSL